MTKRTERDSIGEIKVDSNKFWGAQTQRSLENFDIGFEKMPWEIIEAFAVGTGAVVAPIGKLFYKDSEYIINNQKVGENAQQIFNQLINLQHGIVEEDNGWLTNIK